eukprot:4736522-Amphidinium_carterae.1
MAIMPMEQCYQTVHHSSRKMTVNMDVRSAPHKLISPGISLPSEVRATDVVPGVPHKTGLFDKLWLRVVSVVDSQHVS